MKVKEVEKCQVSDGRWKQDIKINNKSGSARFTVWHHEVGKMEVGKCYRLSCVMIREYCGRKFLSTSKEKSEIEAIDDTGNVDEEDDDDDEVEAFALSSSVRDAYVVGVLQSERYKACFKCNTPDCNTFDLGHFGFRQQWS